MSEGRSVSLEEEVLNSSAVSSSTPGPSSVSSSEEVDEGTLTEDCLLPPPANLEDELAASQKEHQAYLGRYQFLEDKKKQILLLGDPSVSAPRAVETDYDASISSSESSDETSSDMPVLRTNEECSSSSSFQRPLNTEESHQLPNSSDDSLLFDSSCSTPVISSDLLVNSTETTQAAASNCTSQASRDSNDGSPVLTSVNSHSVFGSNEFLSGSGLNPTGSEQEALSSFHEGEESEQHENGEVTGACAAGSGERVDSSGGANVGDIPWSQQGAFPSAEMTTGGTHPSGSFNGTATNWERLGARPKQGQAQHSVIRQMPGEAFIPVTDGLAGDFLARHTQDKALHDSLYQNVGAEMHGDDCHFPALCSLSRLADPTEARLGSTTSWPSLDRTGNAFLLPCEDVRNSAWPEARAVPSYDPTRATGVDSTTTSWSLLVCHSSNATTVGDEVLAQRSTSGTSIPEPSRASVLNNRDFGPDSVESTDNSLLALEQRVGEACALVERVLREREEREQFGREIERKEQLIREQRARERREREEREIQEAERWPQQQEAITARSQWLCEHYQRHCRVWFPCCTQEREIQEAERLPHHQQSVTAQSHWPCECYQRHCRVRFSCCAQFYPCHHCHNISKACDNKEAKVCHASHLKCSHCQHEQEIGEDSEKCHMCGSKMPAYFCFICPNVISADSNPYHCEKCGICRIHKDKSFHCEVCNVCLDERLQGNHNCRPNSGHDECCFCLKDTFSGCQILPCSHKVHRECAIAMIQYGIHACPICHQPLRGT